MDKGKQDNSRFRFGAKLNTCFIFALYMFVIQGKGNILPWYAYIGAAMCYIALSILGIAKNIKSIKTIADYLIIIVGLWGKSFNSPLYCFSVLYPLIASVLLDRQYKNIVINSFLTFIAAFAIGWIQGLNEVSLPVFVLCFIGIIFGYRMNWISIERKIADDLNEYFTNPEKIHKLHEVYKPIIEDLNAGLGKNNFLEISAYVLKGDKFFIINSSSFSWYRLLDLTSEEKKTLATKKKMRVLRDKYIGGNSHLYLWNYMYYFKSGKSKYIISYQVLGNKKLLFYLKTGLGHVLEVAAGKIVNMLGYLHSVKNMRNREFDRFSGNKQKIDEAIGTMHFIRNKLSSIGNLLEYMLLPEDRQTVPLGMVRKNLTAAYHDYKGISEYANRLLESNLEELYETDIHEISMKEIFIMLSEIAEDNLGITPMFKGVKNSDAYLPDCSRFDLKVLFADLINNMKKHGRRPSIIMSIEESDAMLIFSNELKKRTDGAVVSILNNKSVKSRNTQKKTHGILSIKELTARYGFTLKAEELNGDTEDKGSRLIITIKLPILNKILKGKDDGEENIGD